MPPRRPAARPAVPGLRLCLPLCLLLQLAPLQGAEQAEVKTGVRESKADEAAMARARRQAQSPMRWILEAGRIARRPGEGEAPSTREAGGAREGSGPPPRARGPCRRS
jgi:hypothetical protein